MYRFGNPYTVGFLAVAALMFALAAVAYRRRSRRVSTPLAGFLLATCIWTLADAVRIAAPTAAHVLFWNKVAYLGVVAVPPTFLYFVADVTNHERFFRRRYVAGMVAAPVVAYAVVLTNPWHRLWRAGEVITPGTTPPVLVEVRGPAWFPWAVFAYGVILLGLYFLATDALRSTRSRLYRSQAGLILVGIVAALGSNLLFTVFDLLRFDPVPIALSVTGLAFAAAIFRFDLLDITPIARDVVLENLDGGVLVLDAEDAVVDANPRARRILDLDADAVPGVSLAETLADYPGVVEHLRETHHVSETVSVEVDGERRHFEVEVSHIEDDLGTTLGRVVVFTEVTGRIRSERELRDRTGRLREQNERLDELASLVSHDLRDALEVTGRRVDRVRELLDGADLPDDQRATFEAELEGIERAAARAGEITGELLDLSREGFDADPPDGTAVGSAGDGPDGVAAGSAGELPVDGDAPDPRSIEGDALGDDGRGPVALRSVATDAWDTVDTRDLELSVRGSRQIDAEAGQLRRLLENCYRNAVEHAEGATRVVVGASAAGFYVEDDGAGIPEDARERALERGYSMASDGSGLGLAIVERVAEDHGWRVRLAEADGGGARVEVAVDPE